VAPWDGFFPLGENTRFLLRAAGAEPGGYKRRGEKRRCYERGVYTRREEKRMIAPGGKRRHVASGVGYTMREEVISEESQ